MKKVCFLAVLAIVTIGVASCTSRKKVNLKTDVDSVSYLIGSSYGEGLREQMKSFPVGGPGNVEALIAGFVNAALGDSVFLGEYTQSTLNAYIQDFFQKASARVADEEKAAGDKFLAENKTKSGVFETESGLQYKVLTAGTGPKPGPEDTVKVHYTGKLLDGKVFDSSVERGEPLSFPLNAVIPGWSEGVQLMPLGSKYILWIPAELAYGANPQSPDIKPNSTLEFEVELLDIMPKK